MVEEMKTRAADLRTQRDRAPSLFAEPGFWREVLERSLNAAAPRSELAAKIRSYMIAARKFAEDCLGVIPDFGAGNLPSGQSADSAAPATKST
jgi:hypothetical protein